MLILPFEYSPQEFFATEIVARLILGPAQMFFHSGLGSDSSVVHPRQPEDFESLHPGAARKNVLDRIAQNMTEGQHAGDVWWRHHDRKCRLRRLRICYEIAVLKP